MDGTWFETWLLGAPLWMVGVPLLLGMCAVAYAAYVIRRRRERGREAGEDSQEGYVVSGVVGLLALLTGFTFSLAVDRFETRRHLVLEEANAIGTTYLRAQLIVDPHRSRLSDLLVRYTDNKIHLGKATRRDAESKAQLARNDALITDLWTETAASWDSIKGYDFSSSFLDSMNNLIDLDAARKASRAARVPTEVYIVLFIYLTVTAGVMGYVMRGPRGRATAAFLLGLTTLSVLLILDVDRPMSGRIIESQRPMEELQKFLAGNPPAVFDRWKGPEPPVGPAARR
jgi:hypothetical protein